MEQDCSSKRTEGLGPDEFDGDYEDVFVRGDEENASDLEEEEYYDYDYGEDDDYSSRGMWNF